MFRRLRSKLKNLVEAPASNSAASETAPGSADRSAGSRGSLAARREPAPVIVYFERERSQHLLERVTELLTSHNIPHRTLDVRGDAATLAFITREAKCDEDDLPVVFVAATPIGGYDELVNWDHSGKLREAVFGV